MQLDDFVATSLEQIVNGVTRAQAAVEGSGARINCQVETAALGRIDRKSGTAIQEIEFDIAVTASEGGKSGSGLKVAVPGMISVGMGSESDKQHSALSRVKFAIPVVFPKQSSEEALAKARNRELASRGS